MIVVASALPTAVKVINEDMTMPDKQVKAILSKVGVIDHDGDIILPGAFDDSLSTMSQMQMLHMHRRGNIIGKWTNLRMDADLLKADGTLFTAGDDGYDLARMTARLVKEALMRGVSVGFRPIKWSSVQEEGRGTWGYGWDIEKLELIEASIVDRPANDAAQVLEIKQKLDKHEGEALPIVYKFFECDVELVVVEDTKEAELAELARKEAEIAAYVRR